MLHLERLLMVVPSGHEPGHETLFYIYDPAPIVPPHPPPPMVMVPPRPLWCGLVWYGIELVFQSHIVLQALTNKQMAIKLICTRHEMAIKLLGASPHPRSAPLL